MPKPSHRSNLLKEGLHVLHQRGYHEASVRDIVRAAGAPQGSFTNHFPSKEAFSLEALNLYFETTRELVRVTLQDPQLPPLERIRRYIDAHEAFLKKYGTENGCLYGNFTAEATDHSEMIRKRLTEIFDFLRDGLGSCLRDAVKARELPRSFDVENSASFILFSLQGAILIGKAERSLVPIQQLRKVLFAGVLSGNAPGRRRPGA